MGQEKSIKDGLTVIINHRQFLWYFMAKFVESSTARFKGILFKEG